MVTILKKLAANNTAKLIGLFVLGVAIGALFYPTKHIEERVKQEYQEKIQIERDQTEKVRVDLTEDIDKLKGEKTSLTIETSQKITQLRYEVKDLQSKKKETWYKIVRPDGTIEERSYKESEVNESTKVVVSIRAEFDRKTTEISERWQRVHISRVKKLKKEFTAKENVYKEQIAKFESEKIVDINPKTIGLEVGALSDQQYYMHGNVDVVGPLFLGIHTQSNFAEKYSIGAGLGMRF